MKFLFFSPYTLNDFCSGAAMSVRTLLEELASLGHLCRAVTGTVMDGKSPSLEATEAMPVIETHRLPGTDIIMPLRAAQLRGVEHMILGAHTTTQARFRALEETALRDLFLRSLASFGPDVVLTFGGLTSNLFAGQAALSQGRKVVLYLASDTYTKSSDFLHVSHVATVSEAMGRRVECLTKIPITVLAAMVRRSDVIAAQRTPTYITFINPVLSKGLRLAAAITTACRNRNKPYRFLFVESRGRREAAERACPELASCTNVAFVRNTTDMKEIYQQTKVLLFPSLIFEAAGRSVIEANANGIPVLASNVGGIPEMLDGAGYLFNPSRQMLEKWDLEPAPNYVEEWLAVVDRLHNDAAEYDDAVRRARAADDRYDVTRLARKFADAMA